MVNLGADRFIRQVKYESKILKKQVNLLFKKSWYSCGGNQGAPVGMVQWSRD